MGKNDKVKSINPHILQTLVKAQVLPVVDRSGIVISKLKI